MRGNRWVVALAAAVALGAAACGVRSDVAAGVEVVASAPFLADAAERTVDAGTGRFEMVVTLVGVSEDHVSMTIEGAYDTAAEQATMRADLSGLAGIAGAGGAAGAALGGTTELVVDGTTFYMRLPALADAAGQEWVSFDAGALGAAGSPMPAGGLDPRVVLDLLHGSGDVETVGTEDVRDVATTHLRATLSVDDLAASVPAEQRAALQAMLDSLQASGTLHPFPLDVWVDGAGLVRRVALTYTVPAGAVPGASAGGDVGVTVSADYFDFGEPVEIVVPDPSDVATIPGGD
jgi:hypothetical protein